MNNTRGRMKKTSVKFFINILTLAFAFQPSLSLATDPAPATPSTATPVVINNTGNVDPCDKSDAESQKSCLAKKCRGDLLTSAQSAVKEMKTACAEGSLGDNCFEKAVTCSVVTKEQTFDTATTLTNAVLQGMGLNQAASLGTPKSSSTSTCPQYSGQNYQQRKRDLESDIKDIQNQLNDLKKDLAQQQKDTQKEISDIQDDIQKSKKDTDKAKADLDTDQRQQIADFNKNQNDLKNQMRQNNLNMLQLKGKLVDSQRNQSMDLLKLNDSATKAACVKAAQEAYSKFQAAAAATSMSFATRSQQKQMVLNQYNDCLKTFDQSRQQTIEKYRQEQQTLSTSIAQAQSELDDMQHSMDLAQSQLTEMQNSNTAQKSKIDQDLIQEMQTAQTKMQAAQSDFQQQQQIATQRQQELNQQLNAKQNELNSLGPVPDSDATTSSAKASAKIRANEPILEGYINTCCKDNSLCDSGMQGVYNEYKRANSDSFSTRSSDRSNSPNGGQ